MGLRWYYGMVIAVAAALASCGGVYYGALEKLGYPKRDLMVSRVESAQQSQREAKEEFRTAIERFKSVIKLPDSTLEAKYDQLKKELDRCESRAKDVHQRIASVADVSEALFEEWEGELKQYQNQSLRRTSEQKLLRTKARYEQLIRAMRAAEARIEPVLQPLRDDVLFLKHNLNAQAISALGVELNALQTDVDSLMSDLERSIAEADEFIAEISSE